MASFSELQEASLGLTDKTFGLAKEAVGTLLNRPSLADAGRAQQDKGSARLDAIKHEAAADASRGRAALQNRREQAHQDKPSPMTGKGGGEFAQTGPTEAFGGMAERFKGRVKEAAGAVVDDEDMRREGEAQRAKGRAKTEAAKEEGEAESSRAKVRAADARQRGAEQADR